MYLQGTEVWLTVILVKRYGRRLLVTVIFLSGLVSGRRIVIGEEQ